MWGHAEHEKQQLHFALLLSDEPCGDCAEHQEVRGGCKREKKVDEQHWPYDSCADRRAFVSFHLWIAEVQVVCKRLR